MLMSKNADRYIDLQQVLIALPCVTLFYVLMISLPEVNSYLVNEIQSQYSIQNNAMLQMRL